MNEPFSTIETAQIVTAICSLIVAGAICYSMQLLLGLRDEFLAISHKLNKHLDRDEIIGDRIERIEQAIEKLTKVRLLRRRDFID